MIFPLVYVSFSFKNVFVHIMNSTHSTLFLFKMKISLLVLIIKITHAHCKILNNTKKKNHSENHLKSHQLSINHY